MRARGEAVVRGGDEALSRRQAIVVATRLVRCASDERARRFVKRELILASSPLDTRHVQSQRKHMGSHARFRNGDCYAKVAAVGLFVLFTSGVALAQETTAP